MKWFGANSSVELDIRRLEQCSDIQAIAGIHRDLGQSQRDDPSTALLRGFGLISQDVEAALRQESDYNQRLAFRAVEADLDGLLLELPRGSSRYAVRFTRSPGSGAMLWPTTSAKWPRRSNRARRSTPRT